MFFYRLVFVAYRNWLGRFFKLTVEIRLRSFAYCGTLVWSFFYLRSRHPEIGVGFFAYSSPTASKEDAFINECGFLALFS